MLAAKSFTGDVRLTVPDTAAPRGPPTTDLEDLQPQDLILLVDGDSLIDQSTPLFAAPSTDPTAETRSGIWAKVDISLWVGDDVVAPATTEIVAGGTIYIHGDANRLAPAVDAANPDPNGTPAGANADAALRHEHALRRSRSAASSTSAAPPSTTDVDARLRPRRRRPTSRSTARFLGARTRVFGSENLSATDETPCGRACRRRAATARTSTVVDHLSTPDDPRPTRSRSTARPATTSTRSSPTGSLGADRNYVINVLDTGAGRVGRSAVGGADIIAVYGATLEPDHDGLDARRTTAGRRHLPAAPRHVDRVRRPYCSSEQHGAAAGVRRRAAQRRRRRAAARRDRDGYIAHRLVRGRADQLRRRRSTAASWSTAWRQRPLRGRRQQRHHDARRRRRQRQLPDRPDLRPPARRPANVDAPNDAFDTVATTRGYLSPGTSAPLVAMGGTGDDQFTVYSQPGRAAARGQRRQRPVRRPRLRPRRDERRRHDQCRRRPVPARRQRRRRAEDDRRLLDRRADADPRRRGRRPDQLQHQRPGLDRRRQRLRQGRRARHRVRRPHRDHRQRRLRRRPQRPLRDRRGASRSTASRATTSSSSSRRRSACSTG